MKDLAERLLTPDMLRLREAYLAAGHDVRFVGGPVRDVLIGHVPKDIDLCSDAPPGRGMEICEGAGFRTFATGLQHGTFTVVLESPVEITTLRRDHDGDGRHASVEFISDWVEDLARRDLPINAMSLTLDGELLDPFGGRDDLMQGRVRFVGDAEARMREDYLRILRWLRFHARFASGAPLDREAFEASRRVGHGLAGISRERIWSEVRRMMSTPEGLSSYRAGIGGLHAHMGIPRLGDDDFAVAAEAMANGVGDPVAVLVSMLREEDRMSALAQGWKWSGQERDRGLFLARHLAAGTEPRWLVAHDGARRDWTSLLCRLRGQPSAAEAIESWQVPEFPLKGADLLEAGFAQGKAMGDKLRDMKDAWARGGYVAGREELLESLRSGPPSP